MRDNDKVQQGKAMNKRAPTYIKVENWKKTSTQFCRMEYFCHDFSLGEIIKILMFSS
jgi:hypothetical protein